MITSADILNARILVVDDKQPNVELIEGMLRVGGYTSVHSTTNPTEVCALHRANRYDLILLDLQMPGMDGFQVMEGLKDIEADGYLPVLVITAQPDHKLRALNAGAKDFVSKPFDLAELRARVHNILEVRLLHLEAKNQSKVLEETVRELNASREIVRLQTMEEQKTRERELVLVRESNADLQQFAFMASHDLQEPLRTVITFSQLLERRHREQLDADAKQLLQTVLEAGQRMSTLIRDLLAFSQLASEENTAPSVHMHEDLETALGLLGSSLHESGAIVTYDSLPSVRIERTQLVRLFQNLIGNALKFRKKEEPSRIHVSAEQTEHEWIITVRDNGIGFRSDQAEHLFAPFKRLHGAEYPGSGIGLAACKRIVDRYGGRIGAESELGHGARFWFTIPLKPRVERSGHEGFPPR